MVRTCAQPTNTPYAALVLDKSTKVATSTINNAKGEIYFQQIIHPIHGRFPVMSSISSANLMEQNIHQLI